MHRLFSTSLIPNIRKNPLSQGAHCSTVLAAAQVSVQSAVQTTAEPPLYFSGLNNFAMHHPEPMAKPRTSLHSSLQRVRDISYTSCFLSLPAMGNLQVTDEEADMLHPSHSIRKRPCWKMTLSVFSQESLIISSFTRLHLCWVFAELPCASHTGRDTAPEESGRLSCL